MNPLYLILVGLITGVYSGIMGLGGGTVMIPIMVLALGFDQKQAVATSLAAMIPPVTFPAVYEYYKSGNVHVSTAAWIALGIAVGAFIGGSIGASLPDKAMRMIFGFVLVYVGGYTIFQTIGKHHLTRSILFAGVMASVAALFFLATRWYDLRHS